jgi:heme/copper-type cytochrome/quinol oxidase subunit 4
MTILNKDSSSHHPDLHRSSSSHGAGSSDPSQAVKHGSRRTQKFIGSGLLLVLTIMASLSVTTKLMEPSTAFILFTGLV